MKRLLFYCQHVLGMGHLVRSMELIRGLENFQVCLVNGGEFPETLAVPSNTRMVQLPAIRSDDDFHELHADPGMCLEQVKEKRRSTILDVLDSFLPDVVVIELFPFGRRKFAFELLPVLDRIRTRHPSTRVVCSLRDIVVSKQDREKYEGRVRAIMNEYFDLLLVHSDPALQRLDESFTTCGQLGCRLEYTGFVTRKQETPASRCIMRDNSRIVASVGGGRVGYELLEAAINASERLKTSLDHELEVFCGPFMPDGDCARLASKAESNACVHLARFTPSLAQRMMYAGLSISMAGYNTCMDVIVSGVPALLYPFTGGGNQEQLTRALKLETLGAATLLAQQDLEPANLAQKMFIALSKRAPERNLSLDIDGVRRTAELLERLVEVQ